MDHSRRKTNDFASTVKFTKAEEGLPASDFRLVESRKWEVGRSSSAFVKRSKQAESRMQVRNEGKKSSAKNKQLSVLALPA